MRNNQHQYQILNKKCIVLAFTLLLMTLCSLGIAMYLRAKSGSNRYAFLGWDMFLAWVPLIISTMIALIFRSKAVRPGWLSKTLIGVLGLIWLFFLPNAAYLFTEMLHAFRYFIAQPESPFWFDMDFWYSLTLTFGVAIVGLMLSICSIRQIEHVLQLLVHRSVGWIIVGFILLLSGLGVYIGRFNRWNSWDIVSRPGQIVIDLMHDLSSASGLLVEFVTLMFVIQGFAYIIISLISSSITREGKK
ncbi:DUF1361 domain-containing protein [Paenibacillus polysaccharolyticus]|uniref:DUF1361 domain-containing protein n=1 Tax=Paenibacillus polysaccharolyticus TaxID=582692 RepID=UPI00203FF48D|nr:DUF1361 domain-containing protein [Paenibacillus polysaccharolyticus]MCM3133503.1 DUF1361 domain-containing protein [Paenibacillus polysaccharolyticus]